MEDFDIKKEYEELKKKYPELPSFEDIEDECELSLSEISEPFLLSRQIRRRAGDRVSFYCRIIEAAIYPSGSSPISAYELNHIPEKVREEISKVYKKLRFNDREQLALNLKTEEAEDIKFIVKAHQLLIEVKPLILNLVNSMKAAWQVENKEKGEAYFG